MGIRKTVCASTSQSCPFQQLFRRQGNGKANEAGIYWLAGFTLIELLVVIAIHALPDQHGDAPRGLALCLHQQLRGLQMSGGQD
jgi:prepilin-type N-terminal cleavage/methylation domain-containing protein